MDEALERFRRDYQDALASYLRNPIEEALETAYQLGRAAMTEKVSSLEVAQVHHQALTDALTSAAQPHGLDSEEIEQIMKAATTFRLETLSTFEIMQRSYFEAQQLYQREHDVAETLRQSLLPQSLPGIPGMEVEAYYRPGGSGNQVGGDFYDLFSIGRGQWGLLLGDVCGKGAPAAAITAMARHTARTAILLDRHPTGVLRLVNQAFLNFGPDYFCTMLHARIEKTPAATRMTFATGGHPQPLKLSAEGVVSNMVVEGPLLGVIEDWTSTAAIAELQPGDAMVLYTDGVIEARMPDGFFGDERLADALECCAGYDAAKIVGTLIEALSDEKESPRRDDMAILALRVTP